MEQQWATWEDKWRCLSNNGPECQSNKETAIRWHREDEHKRCADSRQDMRTHKYNFINFSV